MMRTEIANALLNHFQAASDAEPLLLSFLNDYLSKPDILTVENILHEYKNYFSKLSSEDKLKLSTIFWFAIKTFGTPIIEIDRYNKDECRVYFIFPKDHLENQNALFLQGAFHGYGGMNERNKLDELTNTGIFYRVDSIPLNAILNYQYQQNGAQALNDDNSTHRNVYHHRYTGGIVLRVNPNPERAFLGKQLGDVEENYWDIITSTTKPGSQTNFASLPTLYTDTENNLHTCDDPLPQKVDIYNPVPPNLSEIPDEDLTTSPYDKFTRAIHIYLPRSHQGAIKNIIVFNDGRPYILAGMVEQADLMVTSGKLPANSALIFITSLQGLIKTMPGIQDDERFKLSGMGVRTIDFELGIDNYISFLKKIFRQLENNLNIPNDARCRAIVGASLSGTATIYMALKAPDLFSQFIAQSPSPSNDQILVNLSTNKQANIQLSCGVFEQPRYNDTETDCYHYAEKLSERFDLPFNSQQYHGHNHAAWVIDLATSLQHSPSVSDKLDKNAKDKATESSRVSTQSIFSQSKEMKANDKQETIQVLRKKGG